jgi:hypothetical protein
MRDGSAILSRITNHELRITFSEQMFFRFILYCVLAYFALRFVRRLLSPPRSVGGSRAAKREAVPAQMIRCENCGMFITQTSALLVAGREFCSKSCAQKVNRV